MEPTIRYIFIKSAYDNCQDCIKMIDQKMAILVAILAIVPAVTMSYLDNFALTGDSILQKQAHVLTIALLATMMVTVGSLFCTVVALRPRKSRTIPLGQLEDDHKIVGKLFWAEVINDRATHPTLMNYLSVIDHASETVFTAEMAYETMKLANILSRKMAWGRWAIRLFEIALSLWTGITLYYIYAHIISNV